MPLEVVPAPQRIAGSGGMLSGRMFGLWRIFRPRSVDVEISLQQLSCMLRSDLPLLAAIKTCAEQASRHSIARIWIQVAERIQGGASLSSAMSGHACFSNLVVTLVAVGEETGALQEVLLRASGGLERRRLLLTNMRTALMYPTIVIAMAVGLVSYMMVGLIPKLKVFLGTMGRRLPAMTQTLIDVSTYIQTHLLQGAIALLLAAAGFSALYAIPRARMSMDRLALRIPVIGSVLRIAATSLFARSMSTLLSSGVRLTEALRVAEPLHGNRYLRKRVSAARERVLQGATFAEPLGEGRGFLPMLSNMVVVGESSGTLDHVLEEVATFHEKRLESTIRQLGALVEPAIILVVGGIVGFIYIAFFMAIYAVAGNK